MPGVEPASIDIDIDAQLLATRAQRTAAEHAGAKWLAQERPNNSYLRQFSIGEGVDRESIVFTCCPWSRVA
ncbi:Hsp20/alpha crystallin family protein [Curtobacterium sp. ISL-83]|nr:Hsp20/alpha crystallin family protein [Curtobacterium sp. ISL-83]